jgi:hypothetical protein
VAILLVRELAESTAGHLAPRSRCADLYRHVPLTAGENAANNRYRSWVSPGTRGRAGSSPSGVTAEKIKECVCAIKAKKQSVSARVNAATATYCGKRKHFRAICHLLPHYA